MTKESLNLRRSRRLEEAFRDEELAGFRLSIGARLVALVVIAVWLQVWTEPPRSYWLDGILVAFGLSGIGFYALLRSPRHRPWQTYFFVGLDFILLTFATIGLELVIDDSWPPQMILRNGTVVYFFLFLGLLSLSYAPRLMIWGGLAAAAAWSLGILLIFLQPGTVTTAGHETPGSHIELTRHLHPRFVDVNVWLQDVVVLLLAAGVLACVVWRGKRLVQRQAAAERERGNLARYFSPNMVDQLAKRDEPLDSVRSQPVAVLFADIVGFTQVCEALPPEVVVGLLREFHGRMARAVFAHEGTVDKYIGDAIMATFGTPLKSSRDARNALACARAMVMAMAEWNRERWAAGSPPIRTGIGLHYGPAVIGDIGGERRFEYAVIGDTVNVASRLEGLTRDLGVDIAVSEDLARKVREEGAEVLLKGFIPAEPQQLRNRGEPLAVWTWRDAA
jgi:adenylate cyclase